VRDSRTGCQLWMRVSLSTATGLPRRCCKSNKRSSLPISLFDETTSGTDVFCVYGILVGECAGSRSRKTVPVEAPVKPREVHLALIGAAGGLAGQPSQASHTACPPTFFRTRPLFCPSLHEQEQAVRCSCVSPLVETLPPQPQNISVVSTTTACLHLS